MWCDRYLDDPAKATPVRYSSDGDADVWSDDEYASDYECTDRDACASRMAAIERAMYRASWIETIVVTAAKDGWPVL